MHLTLCVLTISKSSCGAEVSEASGFLCQHVCVHENCVLVADSSCVTVYVLMTAVFMLVADISSVTVYIADNSMCVGVKRSVSSGMVANVCI